MLLKHIIHIFYIRSDDEETFCRALVEYTRACSHVGYPVREWRDSFPSCCKLLLPLMRCGHLHMSVVGNLASCFIYLVYTPAKLLQS